jgi:hypothetical protein
VAADTFCQRERRRRIECDSKTKRKKFFERKKFSKISEKKKKKSKSKTITKFKDAAISLASNTVPRNDLDGMVLDGFGHKPKSSGSCSTNGSTHGWSDFPTIGCPVTISHGRTVVKSHGTS